MAAPSQRVPSRFTNKENIPRQNVVRVNTPREIKDRREWDPEFRKQQQFEDASSDESFETDSNYETDAFTGTYKSGGLASLTPKTAAPSHNAGHSDKAANRDQKGDDGFQRVTYNRHTKHGSTYHNKGTRKRRVPRRVNLNLKSDNPAKAAFRKHEKPVAEFILDRDCDMIEPDTVRMYSYLEELGVRLGSFIRPPQNNRDRLMLLWGNRECVEKTKRELKSWATPYRTTPMRADKPKDDNFGKVFSTAGGRYKQDQDKVKTKADRYRFQQVPAKGAVFDYQGNFLWDKDEVRPQDILGESLEAMDPIRFKYRCHILFDEHLSAFRIFAHKTGAVEKVFGRIIGIMKGHRAKTNRSLTRFDVEPHSAAVHRKEIRLVKSPGAGDAHIPRLTGKPLETVEREGWLTLGANLKNQNIHGIENALRATIPNLAYYSGQLKMRVNTGTFALTEYRRPETVDSIPFQDFLSILATQQTKGVLIKDLYIQKDAVTIMDQIYKAQHIFQPIDNMTPSLRDVTPSFSARFECSEHEKPQINLQVDMIENAGAADLYDKTNEFWSKSGRGNNIVLLSLFAIRLDGGPSWNLQISKEETFDTSRITPRMKAFAKSVKLKKSPASGVVHNGQRMFQWESSLGSMEVISFQQKSSLKYRLVEHTEWIIEISRYDTYGDSRNPDMPSATSWAATLSNSDWDSELVSNMNLEIGETSDWKPTINTFFPKKAGTQAAGSSQGVQEFLQIVGKVTKFLADIKKELPHLRT